MNTYQGWVDMVDQLYRYFIRCFIEINIMRAPALSRLVEDYARKSCRAFPLEEQSFSTDHHDLCLIWYSKIADDVLYDIICQIYRS